jgi:hypothetical protein
MSEMQTNPDASQTTDGQEDEEFAAAFARAAAEKSEPGNAPVEPDAHPEPDAPEPDGEESAAKPAEDEPETPHVRAHAPADGDAPAKEPPAAAPPDGQQPGEELNELRRKAQLFDTAEGRLRQTQAELAALKRKAAEPPAAPQCMAVEEVPEAIREDMTAFLKSNPEYAEVMLEKSRSGERLRRALEEYGPEHVLVEDMADRTLQRLRDQKDRAARAANDAEAVATEHFAAIGREHPDFAAAYAQRQENPEAFTVYRRKLEAWAEGKPGAEYKRLAAVMDHGTAPEVNRMLREFKDEQAAGGERRREKLDRAAKAAMVPPGKPSPRPSLDAPDKDSFEAGWNERIKEKK